MFYQVQLLNQSIQVRVVLAVLVELECSPVGRPHILHQQHRIYVPF